MTPAISAQATPFSFRDLPFYRREEVALSNWYARAFQSTSEWRHWAGEAFGDLLQSPSRTEIRLVVKHSLEHDKQDALYKLSGATITIGRSPENEIMLPAQSVTKQHARLTFENGGCLLEDLGSTLGTYVANQKLAPHKRISLAPGTQFTIFPYLLTLEERFEWVRGSQVEIGQAETRTMAWEEFQAQSSDALVRFPVSVHPPGSPNGLVACLEAGRNFLEHLLGGMLAVPGSSPALAGLLPTDSELLGFLLLSVLERANRHVKFPFQFLLGKALDPPAIAPDARGAACAFSVAWTGFTGAFRLFLPNELLAGMQASWTSPLTCPANVSWTLPLSAGYADLTLQETRSLEPGDIVLLTPEAFLALPDGERGWLAEPHGEDYNRFVVDRFFQRRLFVEDDRSEGTETTADLSTLPVRLHVVLGEKEMTLAELGVLQSGAILELERDKSGQVDIALNGKMAGKGTLVEVEGKLGVKILSWSGGRG